MEINLKTLFGWITKSIVFIVVVTLVTGVGTFLYTKFFVRPTYQSSVKFSANPGDSGNNGLTYYKSVAPEYIEYLNVHEFYQLVADQLLVDKHENYEPSQVQSMVTFSGVVEETSAFYAYVKAGSAQQAMDVAEAVAKCAPERIKSLRSTDTLLVSSYPQPATSPSSPNLINNTIFGLIAGIVISVLLVVFKELLDNNIKTSEEITELFGLPVLGAVPDFSNQEKEGK